MVAEFAMRIAPCPVPCWLIENRPRGHASHLKRDGIADQSALGYGQAQTAGGGKAVWDLKIDLVR